MTDKTYTDKELEEMADALLAEDQLKKDDSPKAAEDVETDGAAKEGEAKKEKGKLDEKAIAALPAAALIMSNEKLRDMLVKGKKKGRLDANEVSDVLDEMDLESEQMDRIYDSLETLGIEVGTEDFLADISDDIEPPMEEIAEIEEEELVDPNTLVDSFNIDDPVRMYLKEIGRVPLLSADEEVTLEKYLQDIALYTNSDYNRETSAMKLMTIHQAKGLEFPYVFVVGLSEGIFPSYRTIRERKRNGLEEERRLMYVAITRAEQALFLTESEGYNYSTQTSKYPSRFIIEIGKELLKRDGKIDPALLKGLKMSIKNLDNEIGENTVAENSAFAEGKNVVHPIFGTGVIISVNEMRQSCEVDFNGKKRNIQWKFLTLK